MGRTIETGKERGRWKSWARRPELLFWPVLLLGVALLTATADFIRDRDAGRDISFWQPYLREIVSTTVVLALLPSISFFHKKMHWRRTGISTYFVFNLALSAVFAVIHVVGTVLITQAPYILNGAKYNFPYIFGKLPYEYPKDLLAYVLILGLINLFEYGRRSLGPRDEIKIGGNMVPVKTRTGVHLISIDEITWIEAARNYIVLHTSDKEHLLRITMGEMEQRLEGTPFVRVHRSAFVNTACIDQIRRSNRAGRSVILRDGTTIRVGHSYYARLAELLGE